MTAFAVILLAVVSFLLGACFGVMLACLVQCARVRQRAQPQKHR